MITNEINIMENEGEKDEDDMHKQNILIIQIMKALKMPKMILIL